jgi:hypothetical protein
MIFAVKVSPKGVTVQPQSIGQFIGPITAEITISYTKSGQPQTQSCFTAFGIAARDAKGQVITNPALETKAAVDKVTKGYKAQKQGGKKSGYMIMKTFTNSVTCNLNADAVAWFKSGGQIAATAKVVRDRRWPSTYKAKRPNGAVIVPKTVLWNIKVG